MSDPTPGNIESTFVTKTKDPIDEHALLVTIRQNNRIARLAEPLRIYEVGKQVHFAFFYFVLALQMLSRDEFDWDFRIVAGLSGGE